MTPPPSEHAWPPVTVVIPVKDWNEQVVECTRQCLKLDYPHFELWLIPDHLPPPPIQQQLDTWGDARLRIVHVGPAIAPVQRNIGLSQCRTEIVAFSDSDAYPRPDWLKRAVPLLKDDVGAVGGPNLLPPLAPWGERISDHVMRSPLGFGAAFVRHVPRPPHFINELPTCNLLVRRLPGCQLPEHVQTGDDMVFCANIRARGMKILYDPDVVVFHHRRTIFKPLLTQFFFYGLFKGVLARSRHTASHLWNAAPAAWVLVLLALVPVCHLLHTPWPLLPALLYLVAILLESLRTSHSLRDLLPTLAAFCLCHLSYGIGYWRGLLHPPTSAPLFSFLK